MAGSIKQNANELYEKNYHGHLAENMSYAVQTAAEKAKAMGQNYRQNQGGEHEYGEEEMGFTVSAPKIVLTCILVFSLFRISPGIRMMEGITPSTQGQRLESSQSIRIMMMNQMRQRMMGNWRIIRRKKSSSNHPGNLSSPLGLEVISH